MKAGEIRIPHFAHKKNSDCTSGFSEPESHQHLEGKRHLNEFFIRQGLEPSLEHYLPAIRQRPDLLVNFMGRTYAVEYQCSPLSRNSLLDRTQGYIKEGIIPLWILGGYPYQKMKKTPAYELTDFHWSLAKQKAESGLTLISFHPTNQMVYQLSNITPLSSRKVLANLQSQSLTHLSLPFQFPQVSKHWTSEYWFQEKKKWIERKVRFGNIVSDSFLKDVYTSGNNPFLLPLICGLPVPTMENIQEHPVQWQFYIFEDCLKDLKIGQCISLKYIKQKMRLRMKRGDLRQRNFPLKSDYFWDEAIDHYFCLLMELEYFTRESEHLFKMAKVISASKQMEERQSLEEIIIRNLRQSPQGAAIEEMMCIFFGMQDL